MAEHHLAARATFTHNDFSATFLAWYLAIGLLVLVYLFYFNRIIAALLSLVARTIAWQLYSVQVDIQSLQFSPLAGRIFFKRVRYFGQNETIIIQDGYITWQYWFAKVEELDTDHVQESETHNSENSSTEAPSSSDGPGEEQGVGGTNKKQGLPCRILIKSRGFQWFIYNRTPVYDDILGNMVGAASRNTGNSAQSKEKGNGMSNNSSSDSELRQRKKELYTSVAQPRGGASQESEQNDDAASASSSGSEPMFAKRPSLPLLLNLLPVGVECGKAAVVLGNSWTKSILIAKVDRASGHFTAASCNPADLYRQVINFDLEHATVQFKQNQDYRGNLFTEGQQECEGQERLPHRHSWYERLHRPLKGVRAVNFINDMFSSRRGSISGQKRRISSSRRLRDGGALHFDHTRNKWIGLTRYLDDDDDTVEQERWRSVEYARVSSVVDCPNVSLSYYWDIPGKVRDVSSSSGSGKDSFNQRSSPAWGIDIRVRGGMINYGPWTDRQRVEVQQMFFPQPYKDAVAAAPLSIGDQRISTELKIFIIMEEDVILRVPHREETKDWRWKGHKADFAGGQTKPGKRNHLKAKRSARSEQELEARPFGWLDTRLQPDSTVKFSMSMVANENGYQNLINMELKGLEISSSVNHATFLTSRSINLNCDLSNPLCWNILRRWNFHVDGEGVDLFVLRDHLFLLTDLISDWTSGPSAGFYTFVPYEYLLHINFRKSKLCLNANEANIIDNPTSIVDNTFVLLGCEEVEAKVRIPADRYQSDRNRIDFSANCENVELRITMPPWNTYATFLEEGTLAHLKSLHLVGSYTYHLSTSPNLTDILDMTITGSSPKVHLYGFLLKYLMAIKDNYFGDDIHFQTFDEYQLHVDEGGLEKTNATKPEHHRRPTNDLDVMLSIQADECCGVIPSHIYSARKGVRGEVFSVSADLRITNYYLDLSLSSSPLKIFCWEGPSHVKDMFEGQSNLQFSIDGLEATGHRLFGLPPDEPAYMCNWDFEVGEIKGECSKLFVQILTLSIRSFILSFLDKENALRRASGTVVHDVTFLRVRLRPIALALRLDAQAILVNIPDFRLGLNDWSGPLFSDRISVSIPKLSLAIVDLHNISSVQPKKDAATTHALFLLGVEFNTVSQHQDFDANQLAQQRHIALHDLRTNRVPWLLHHSRDRLLPSHIVRSRLRPPAMIFPPIPAPSFSANFDKPTEEKAASLRSAKISRDSGRSDQGYHSLIGGPTQILDHSAWLHTSGFRDLGSLAQESQVFEPTRFAMTTSSPFGTPQFPLLAIIPETKDLPEIAQTAGSGLYELDERGLGYDKMQRSDDDDVERQGIVLSLPTGLVGFCTPVAMSAIIEILEGVHGNDLTSMIDELQLDVVDELSHEGEQRKRALGKTDIRAHIPELALRFINGPATSSAGIDKEYERYDLTLRRAAFCGRSAYTPALHRSGRPVHRFTAHLTLQEASISATESLQSSSHKQAAVNLHIQNLLFWAVKEPSITMHVQLANVHLSSVSRRVNFVSSLADHTIRLAYDLEQRFSKTIRKYQKILQLFVLLLTKQDERSADPPFFSGASHVLRSSHSHLRLGGSWWMVAKLRYVLFGLSEAARASLLLECTSNWQACPADAANLVYDYFEQHRASYTGQAPPTQLLRRIYNTRPENEDDGTPEAFKVQASCNITEIRVVVDPGKSQNEVIIEHCLASLMNESYAGDEVSVDNKGTLTVVSVHFATVAARLDWSFIELAENIMETALSTDAFGMQGSQKAEVEQVSSNNLLQVSVHSDTSILSVAAINVKTVTVCKGLKSSGVLKTHNSMSKTSSFLITLAGSQTDVLSGMVVLSEFRLINLSLAGGQEVKGQPRRTPPWTLVAQGKHTTFRVLQTPLALSGVVDDLIQQEIYQLAMWARRLPKRAPIAKERPQSAAALPCLQFTWMLEKFDISWMILPSLVHQIQGEGVRLFAVSKPGRPSSLHLELKPHHHRLYAMQGEEQSMISMLSLPTIHLHTLLTTTPQNMYIESRIHVGVVKLSASALHAIFNAFNQPAIVELIKDLQKDFHTMQLHLNVITNAPKIEERSKSPTPTIVIAGTMLIDGVIVETLTPASSYLGRPTLFIIDLGRIAVRGSNQESDSGAILSIPELHIALHRVRIQLFQQESQSSRLCGDVVLGIAFRSASSNNDSGVLEQKFGLQVEKLNIGLSTDTAAAALAVAGHLRETLQQVELAHDVSDLKRVTRKRLQREGLLPQTSSEAAGKEGSRKTKTTYCLLLTDTRVIWKIGDAISMSPLREAEDLTLSFKTIDLTSKEGTTARLLVQDFQLQMAPPSQQTLTRSANSAWLPEVVFNVAYRLRRKDVRLAFQAVGKTFDLRLTSQSILPANDVKKSMTAAAEQARSIIDSWQLAKSSPDTSKIDLLGGRNLTSLLVYADFAGAIVQVQGQTPLARQSAATAFAGGRKLTSGKYNQFMTEDSTRTGATFRSPRVAVKVEYSIDDTGRSSLNAETKVSASSNILYPTTVPLVLEISSSIKEIIQESQPRPTDEKKETKVTQPKLLNDDALRKRDPTSLLGKCKLNLGLRICKQEFSLSCQPIARVAARACFEDFYFAINTIDSDQRDKFFTMTANISRLETSVQHVYSRESSGNISIDSIVLSCMNSRHVTAVNGISALLTFSPVKAQINAKQLQDFLLFREIWVPREIRHRNGASETTTAPFESQSIVIQRYQQIAGAGSFTWNASLAIASIDIDLDLGSSIGKSQLKVGKLWTTSQNSSDSEQNLCIGCRKIEAKSTGRMSGLVALDELKVRTILKWPAQSHSQRSTPLVQASASFDHLDVKAGFDFQAFLMVEVSTFNFLMYNVRSQIPGQHDRLVGVLEGLSACAFCTSSSAAQAYSLVQAFQRLIEEKQKAYRASLTDLEKFMRKASTLRPDSVVRSVSGQTLPILQETTAPLRLQTDVVVSMKSIHVGAFSGAFTDTQVLKLDAYDTSARFAVYLEDQKVHSTLGMSLGQLQVALSTIDRTALPSLASEATSRAVIAAATNARGGIILKVPRLVADMQTWQVFESAHIDYIFNSEFQGRVDVGWNYSRISYIRGMHANHVRTLAQRLGKPLPQSAVQISGLEDDGSNGTSAPSGQEKITAVVNVPQSKYSYTALKVPVIETPQLRDMGEATPPLEWIGLHRDRLPTLTHQVVIVALLEVAREVDDAYSKILGSS